MRVNKCVTSRPQTGMREIAVVAATSVVVLLGAYGLPADADSAPTDPTDPATPRTVTADALPTVQMDGVGLTQVVIGRTVYVGGTFSAARPPGAAPGTRTVPRHNLLAYDLVSGRLKGGFRPRIDGTVMTLAKSPDGKRLYLGGTFAHVNGRAANHIAAINPQTGYRVASFKAGTDRSVRAIVAGRTSVWLGGIFTATNGQRRSSLAKVRASDGVLRRWAPRATGGPVSALALSRDNRQVVAGGRFTRVNGSSRPGYGLARLDAQSGSLLPLPVNRVIRNAGTNAGVTSLVSDGTYVYGSAYAVGYRDGNFEGSFKARWSNGSLVWLESCHGDTYSVYPTPRAVYTAGHAHTCATIGGFPDTDPREYHKALAFSNAVTGTNAAEPPASKYHSFTGRPAPTLLTWFPNFDTGTTTVSRQGAWHVTGRGRYVAVAGEFLHANGAGQQGLTRFAMPTVDAVPNKQGPRSTAVGFTPTASQVGPGQVEIVWNTAWDRDNARLTYDVLRATGGTTVVDSVTRESSFWDPQELRTHDVGLASGAYTYRVRATDPLGNVRYSAVVPVTVN